jgi:hypothetical protein
MARTLASIQRIVDIQPIPGADKIVHAQVLGWKCITAIENGFQPGQLCIYIEIDSRVPATPMFAFLEKRNYKVKTIKMRGVYSQGLIIPLKDLKDGIADAEEGRDVTGLLGITKIDTYEPGESAPGKKQHPLDAWLCRNFKIYRMIRPFIMPKKDKGWPSEIPHTDETRVQALWGTLQNVLQLNKKWYVTTKIDGQSATYYYKKKWFSEAFTLYSRELRKKEGDNSTWSQMAEKYKIKEHCRKYCKALGLKSIWLQGEIAGPGIQKNKDHFTEKRLFVFNVYVPQWKRYMNPLEMGNFADGNLELVPMHGIVSLENTTIDKLVEMSNGPSQWSKDDLREGIVIREMEDFGLSRISFKVISPEFCIKYGI